MIKPKKVSPKKVRKAALAEALGEPPAMWFRCPRKGHVEDEEWSYFVTNTKTEQRTLDTGPMCRTCVFEWLTENFQTHRIAPPKRKKGDKPS